MSPFPVPAIMSDVPFSCSSLQDDSSATAPPATTSGATSLFPSLPGQPDALDQLSYPVALPTVDPAAKAVQRTSAPATVATTEAPENRFVTVEYQLQNLHEIAMLQTPAESVALGHLELYDFETAARVEIEMKGYALAQKNYYENLGRSLMPEWQKNLIDVYEGAKTGIAIGTAASSVIGLSYAAGAGLGLWGVETGGAFIGGVDAIEYLSSQSLASDFAVTGDVTSAQSIARGYSNPRLLSSPIDRSIIPPGSTVFNETQWANEAEAFLARSRVGVPPEAVGQMDAAENAPRVAEKGAVSDANFAQSKIRSDETFSEDGVKKYSELAGRPINNVNDLRDAIKDGTIKPSQVPVDYVVQPDGTKLILNTRTSIALDRAGIPKSDWHGMNQTGQLVPDPPPGVKTFDDLARQQLQRNKLPPTGHPDIPRSGS